MVSRCGPRSLCAVVTMGLILVIGLSLQISQVAGNGGVDMRFRERLGYFGKFDIDSPFSKSYESYFKNVMKKLDKKLEMVDINDWRNYRPSSDDCLDFLIGFQTLRYLLNKPHDVIMLDACLGWLFTDAEQSDDKQGDIAEMSKHLIGDHDKLRQDRELARIYREASKFHETPQRVQLEVYEYIDRLLRIHAASPTDGCHSLWLEAYNDFIDKVYLKDCLDDQDCVKFGYEQHGEHPYLNLIFESTREASRICYGVLQEGMRELLVNEYEKSKTVPTSVARRFIRINLGSAKQADNEKWTKEMVATLQIASGGADTNQPINLGRVAAFLDRVRNEDREAIRIFQGALSKYAQNHIEQLPKDESDRFTGRGRFGRVMAQLCRPFVDEEIFLSMFGVRTPQDVKKEQEEGKPFEFYNIIYSIIRITNHETLFGITKEQFEEDVIANNWESLYLATYACQIISSTDGRLSHNTNKAAFGVLFRLDWHLSIDDWPFDVLSEKLPVKYSYKEAQASTKVRRTSGPPAIFGGGKKKFALGLKKLKAHVEEDESEQQDNQDDEVANDDHHRRSGSSTRKSNSFLSKLKILPTNGDDSGDEDDDEDSEDEYEGEDSKPEPVATTTRRPRTSGRRVTPPKSNTEKTAAKVPGQLESELAYLTYAHINGEYPDDMPVKAFQVYPNLPRDPREVDPVQAGIVSGRERKPPMDVVAASKKTAAKKRESRTGRSKMSSIKGII